MIYSTRSENNNELQLLKKQVKQGSQILANEVKKLVP